jgi:hypothetical protein
MPPLLLPRTPDPRLTLPANGSIFIRLVDPGENKSIDERVPPPPPPPPPPAAAAAPPLAPPLALVIPLLSSPESFNIQLNWELDSKVRGDLAIEVNPDPANPAPVLRELGGELVLEDVDTVVESPRRSSNENGLDGGGGGTGAGRYVSAMSAGTTSDPPPAAVAVGGVDDLLPAVLKRYSCWW